MIEIKSEDELEPIDSLDNLLSDLKEYSPIVKKQSDEGYDWLVSDEDWCACVVIPNPHDTDNPIEIELAGEYTLYFRWSHIHYMSYGYGYEDLLDDIKSIMKGETIVISETYDGHLYSCGFTESSAMSSRDTCFLTQL